MKNRERTKVDAVNRRSDNASTLPRFHASTLSLFVAGALLLTVIQPPIGWSFLAWAAFVPFVLACSPQKSARSVALAAFSVGFLYWLANLYWIQPITTLGWLGMGLYLSLFWGLPALAVRAARKVRVPLFIALPILLAGWERLQGFPLGGFYWRFLGHSQYEHLAMIQVADLVGVAGVSFVVAMVNGLLADVIVTRGRGSDASRFTLHASRGLLLGLAVTIAVVAGSLLYGQWRLRQTPEFVTEGPLVGSLQSNVPQSVKQSFRESGKLFDELMVSSKAAAAAGAELIVWPETMVQGILDPALWPRLRSGGDEDDETFLDEDKAFHKALSEHARETTSGLLVGAYGMEIRQDRRGESYLASFNSAYFYHPDGTRDPDRYDKIHLVLFGEYIPFRHRFPWLFEQLKKFFPKGYNPNYSLEHGRRYTVFEMPAKEVPGSKLEVPSEDTRLQTSNFKLQTRFRFGVIICYEDAIPYVGRNFALDDQDRKRIDWLVNISNDGWFVRFPEAQGRVIASSELPQHAAISAFRAVENRLAIIRSVNTGISCLIESTGRIRDGYRAASEDFPTEAMSRTAMAGWFVDRLPIDKRVTFYSRHGEWFANGCAGIFAATLLWPLATRWRKKANAA
ncbi:MAG TPA: apolipoprotein N-acyltransferase [Sedimentisphaerales bacterium]|nr:apolipoprotein N-acyltransferase [Sedimentisphaerales bacterium]